MNPRLLITLLLFVGLLTVTLQADERRHARLDGNPFSRPEVLKPKPPPPPPSPVVNPLLSARDINLDLTATMVSETRPMAVVDGELLGIGDRIQGLKLIAVMEGKAVFSGNGRKFTFEIGDGLPK